MVITNDEQFYWNAKQFADRGKPFGSNLASNIFLGNYRMAEIEATVGRAEEATQNSGGLEKNRCKNR